MGTASPAVSPRHAQAENGPERPPDLALRDLGGAGDPVFETDRHLDHRISEPYGAIDHLDLKGVALGSDLIELDRGEKRSGVAPEARGAVANAKPEQRAAVHVRAR